MARLIALLFAFFAVLYGVWPYYGLYRLDQALSAEDAAAIAPFVDIPAIQADYKARLGAGVDRVLPEDQRGSAPLLDWLAQGLERIGGQAVDQIISLEMVRDLLRQAAQRATDKRPAYFLASVERAFFSSWNRFDVRLGPPETGTQVIMRLERLSWRITAITP
jgi:hypothetical protein